MYYQCLYCPTAASTQPSSSPWEAAPIPVVLLLAAHQELPASVAAAPHPPSLCQCGRLLCHFRVAVVEPQQLAPHGLVTRGLHSHSSSHRAGPSVEGNTAGTNLAVLMHQWPKLGSSKLMHSQGPQNHRLALGVVNCGQATPGHGRNIDHSLVLSLTAPGPVRKQHNTQDMAAATGHLISVELPCWSS